MLDATERLYTVVLSPRARDPCAARGGVGAPVRAAARAHRTIRTGEQYTSKSSDCLCMSPFVYEEE